MCIVAIYGQKMKMSPLKENRKRRVPVDDEYPEDRIKKLKNDASDSDIDNKITESTENNIRGEELEKLNYHVMNTNSDVDMTESVVNDFNEKKSKNEVTNNAIDLKMIESASNGIFEGIRDLESIKVNSDIDREISESAVNDPVEDLKKHEITISDTDNEMTEPSKDHVSKEEVQGLKHDTKKSDVKDEVTDHVSEEMIKEVKHDARNSDMNDEAIETVAYSSVEKIKELKCDKRYSDTDDEMMVAAEDCNPEVVNKLKDQRNSIINDAITGPPKICNLKEEEKELKNSSTNSCVKDKMKEAAENIPKKKRNAVSSFLKEAELPLGKHACFACKKDDDERIKCSFESCSKVYHRRCMEKLPAVKSDVKACPLHLCLPCYNKNQRNPHVSKGDMYHCSKCPTAFHKKDECYIAGSVVLTEDIIDCPKHSCPEEQREYSAVRNLNFCIHCGGNEDLIFCRFCPSAVHKDCVKGKAPIKDNFVCDRCDSHKTVHYNDIVWAKIYDFQWWPAKIFNPEDIPISVEKVVHFDGEFPVQFFLTNEYFWVNTGRVYPFFYKRIGVEDAVKHNFKKFIVDPEFEKAVKLAVVAVENKKILSQASEPVNTKKPPPYKFVKSNRPVGDVQIYACCDSDGNTCGCKATDSNPCGYDTICLNRNMLQECHDGSCEMGDLCQNRKFVKVQNAACKPFYTAVRGWGLKSLEDIKKGHFVIEYVGDLIDEEECERRIKQKQATGDTNFYFCTLDSNRIIDAGPKGNFSRFMNHSCDPNCETQKWIVNGDPRVGIFAKKDIKAGAELTFDYQMDFSHYEKLKCNCGSDRCSGLIGKKPQNGYRASQLRTAEEDPSCAPNLKEVSRLENALLEKSCSKKKSLNWTKKETEQISGKKNEQNGVGKVNVAKKETEKIKINGEMKQTAIVRINGVKALCFKCNTGGKLIECSCKNCDKFFHVRCLKGVKDMVLKKWKCPCHFCKKCKKESTYQCQKCPNAYCSSHVDVKTKAKNFLCLKHR